MSKELTAVILAGGQGTRLRPFTSVLPKPLVPVNGKPILEIIINKLKKNKFKNYYFVTKKIILSKHILEMDISLELK